MATHNYRSKTGDRTLFRTLRPSTRSCGFPCRKIRRCGKLLAIILIVLLIWMLRQTANNKSIPSIPSMHWFHYKHDSNISESFKWVESVAPRKDVPTINILVHFVNAETKPAFIGNFHNMTQSLLSRTDANIRLHLTVDAFGRLQAERILTGLHRDGKIRKLPQIIFLDSKNISESLSKITIPLQKLFSRSKTYYSQSVFFISVAMHRVMAEDIEKMIMLDIDMRIKGDISDLYKKFDDLEPGEIMYITREMQPIYDLSTIVYRRKHPDTLIGMAPPKGKPGFNTGVVLLNLKNMRNNKLYNEYLDDNMKTRKLKDKYSFHGHLGDQDFFTLLSFEHDGMFRYLPCQWNRQLCTWWKTRGRSNWDWDAYHNCTPPIFIYHGNCDTPIPE